MIYEPMYRAFSNSPRVRESELLKECSSELISNAIRHGYIQKTNSSENEFVLTPKGKSAKFVLTNQKPKVSSYLFAIAWLIIISTVIASFVLFIVSVNDSGSAWHFLYSIIVFLSGSMFALICGGISKICEEIVRIRFQLEEINYAPESFAASDTVLENTSD